MTAFGMKQVGEETFATRQPSGKWFFFLNTSIWFDPSFKRPVWDASRHSGHGSLPHISRICTCYWRTYLTRRGHHYLEWRCYSSNQAVTQVAECKTWVKFVRKKIQPLASIYELQCISLHPLVSYVLVYKLWVLQFDGYGYKATYWEHENAKS